MMEPLEKFRLIALTVISQELTDYFALGPEVALSLHAIWSADSIAMRVTQEVYGEHIGTLEVKHPATWFQMLKEQYVPCWLRRHWPVRYAYTSYESRVLYPKVSFPDELHTRAWLEGRETDGCSDSS